jgi:hypothetical protein
MGQRIEGSVGRRDRLRTGSASPAPLAHGPPRGIAVPCLEPCRLTPEATAGWLLDTDARSGINPALALTFQVNLVVGLVRPWWTHAAGSAAPCPGARTDGFSQLQIRARGWGLTHVEAARERRQREVEPELARLKERQATEAATCCVPCGARTRKGLPCRNRSEPGRLRCKLHGGRSTGPRTGEGGGGGVQRHPATRRV